MVTNIFTSNFRFPQIEEFIIFMLNYITLQI